LRTGDDQNKIKESLKDAKNVVVIGGGFISSEVTANLQRTYGKTKKISMVCDF
jgi:NADPH-dependent 2,4-dienoyl-CoA reductase/sulfur reductase-like enzyme